jgi:hypothetical protein
VKANSDLLVSIFLATTQAALAAMPCPRQAECSADTEKQKSAARALFVLSAMEARVGIEPAYTALQAAA